MSPDVIVWKRRHQSRLQEKTGPSHVKGLWPFSHESARPCSPVLCAKELLDDLARHVALEVKKSSFYGETEPTLDFLYSGFFPKQEAQHLVGHSI